MARYCLLLAAALTLGATADLAQTTTRGSSSSPTTEADRTYVASEKAALLPDDVRGRLALARYCQQHAMWEDMLNLAQQTLAIDPTNRVAYGYVRTYDENVPLTEDPAGAEKVQKELAAQFARTFKACNTRHFVVLYDTTDAFVAARTAALEKAYDAFVFWFNMNKLRPALLPKRLVVLLFKERDDFLAYARKVDGADVAWMAGYYSQRTNRAAFFDDATGPAIEKAEAKLAELRAIARQMTDEIEAARNVGDAAKAARLTNERNQLNTRISQMALTVENNTARLNTIKTVHEAVHQVAFNTGIQTRLVDYPLWLGEGLACCFEAEGANGARGLGITNRGRVAVIKEAQKDGKLLNLEKLLAGPDRNAKIDEKEMGLYYAQGWALVAFLYTHHRYALEEFLTAYKSEPAGRPIPKEHHTKLFQTAFGEDTKAVEKEFNEYLKELCGR